MSEARKSAIIGIQACLDIAKVCADKADIVRELEDFLQEQKNKVEAPHTNTQKIGE